MKPVCVSTWSDQRKYFRYFIESAKRVGIEPQNADPNEWPGANGQDWRAIEWFRKSQAQAKFVREHSDQYTHFLFTDSYDIIFQKGWEQILAAYESYHAPIVFASECYPWPEPAQAPLYPAVQYRTKYLNAGMWLAETQAALTFSAALEQLAVKREKCDQGNCVDMFLSGKYGITLDNRSALCFCCNMDSLSYLQFDGEIVNKDSGAAPCLFHGNGASDMMPIVRHLQL